MHVIFSTKRFTSLRHILPRQREKHNKKPAPDGAGKEVSGVKIIIEADSKEIADLVLTLQGQQNQDEIAKNYAIDIFGNKYLEYESGGRGCSNG